MKEAGWFLSYMWFWNWSYFQLLLIVKSDIIHVIKSFTVVVHLCVSISSVSCSVGYTRPLKLIFLIIILSIFVEFHHGHMKFLCHLWAYVVPVVNIKSLLHLLLQHIDHRFIIFPRKELVRIVHKINLNYNIKKLWLIKEVKVA